MGWKVHVESGEQKWKVQPALFPWQASRRAKKPKSQKAKKATKGTFLHKRQQKSRPIRPICTITRNEDLPPRIGANQANSVSLASVPPLPFRTKQCQLRVWHTTKTSPTLHTMTEPTPTNGPSAAALDPVSTRVALATSSTSSRIAQLRAVDDKITNGSEWHGKSCC